MKTFAAAERYGMVWVKLDPTAVIPDIPDPAQLSATIVWLRQHFTEAVSIAELAERSGMSCRAFTRAFHSCVGCTAVQCIHRMRLAHAKECLLNTRDVEGSAAEAGFSDVSYFYRLFKRAYGVTPAAMSRCNDITASS